MRSLKKGESVVKEIPIDMILIEPTIQPRVEQSEETIFQYSLSLAKGDPFPPIDVFELGGKYLLADGGHRLAAYLLEERDSIPARIHQGGRKEALVFASGANAKHGLLRTNQDKHRVVENVLKDPELGKMSNNQIAEICAVSQPFVGRVRWQLTCNGFKFDSVRVSSNGREIQTASIGQKKLSAKPKVKVEPETSSLNKGDERSVQDIDPKAEPSVERSGISASNVGGFTQGVKAQAADSCPVKEGPNGSGEAIATPESDSPPDGPVVDEELPQGAEGVDKVEGDGATHPEEPEYPNDPAVLKRLLEQKDQLIKKLLAENRKLKEEVEYLREQLTKDTTV